MEQSNFKEISKIYIDDNNDKLVPKYQEFIDSLDDNFFNPFYNKLCDIFPEYTKYILEEDFYGYTSTVGWHRALQGILGKEKYDYLYDELEWYDLDYLDDEIENKLIEWKKSK